jgi:proton-translocating NADH-quinone oxidoreductase chain L
MYLTCYNFLGLVTMNSLLFYYLMLFNTTYYINLGIWFNVAHLTIYWEFIFDALAVSMLVMVSFISCLVHLYSFSYMKQDPHFIRFVSFLSLFTFFMFVLVTANNFFQLFLGWEGVGLCSYLLINFWFTRLQANKAAIKALLMNRIGDIGFLIGMSLLFNLCYSLDFSTLVVLLPIYVEYNFMYLDYFSYLDSLSFFFFIGVVGKSAQIGLHTWLPAAMEGPTPVSALIHAATMVTAGIYLLMRCSFLFECSERVRFLIVIVGALTALFSSVTAIFLYDIKKIIAYSTCSQLGYMAVACGLSQYSISLFHLINHAFFKALLFLAAGAVIHSFNNEQDVRRLSLIFARAPFLWIIFFVGNFAIMGLPFLSGFYSKDLIIEFVYFFPLVVFYKVNLLFIIILLATLCTGCYSLRLAYYLFFKVGVAPSSARWLQQPFFIQVVLILLAAGSCCCGYFLVEIYSPFFNFVSFSKMPFTWTVFSENEWLPWYIKLAPVLINGVSLVAYSIFIVFLSSYLYFELFGQSIIYYFQHLRFLVQNNFYFNELYNYVSLLQFHFFYRSFFLIIDKGVLELMGPSGLFFLYRHCVYFVSWFYYQNLFLQVLFLYHSLLLYFFYLFFFLS